jgi:hypothetical protein
MSTRSESLIARVRTLAHEERNATGEATSLQVAALELAQEHEILVAQALKTVDAIHELVKTKEGWKGDGESFGQIIERRRH